MAQWPSGLDPAAYQEALESIQRNPAAWQELLYGEALEQEEALAILRWEALTARRIQPLLGAVQGLTALERAAGDVGADWFRFSCPACRQHVSASGVDPVEAPVEQFGYIRLQHAPVRGADCPLAVTPDHTRERTAEEFTEALADKLGLGRTKALDLTAVRSRRKLAGEVRWLIPGVMEAGKLAALFGPAKAGKSLLALQWAVEAAQAGLRVVYLDEENDPDEVDARLESMGIDPEELDGRLSYHSFTNWCVDTEDGAAAILEATQGADLVVFDSWNKFFHSGDQNGSGPLLAAYRLVVKPLRAAGVGILRLDHTGHEESKRPAGNHVKLGDVDHNWMMRAKRADRGQPVQVTLTHTENRTNRGEDVIRLVRQVEPLLWHARPGAVAPGAVEDVAAQEPTEDAKVLAVAEALDEVSAPLDWTVRQCMAALQQVGKGCRRDLIGPAQRYRNRTAPVGSPGA